MSLEKTELTEIGPDAGSTGAINPDETEVRHHDHYEPLITRSWLFSALVLLVGAAACGIILAVGISNARRDQQSLFNVAADDILKEFDLAFEAYLVAGLWLHQATWDRDLTHKEFRVVYEYLISGGLEVQGVGFAMNVTHSERPAMENVTRSFLEQNYPDSVYQGFTGLEFDSDFVEPHNGPRSNHSFYFPLRFVEPMEDFIIRNSLDLDMNSLPPHRKALTDALATWTPAMTERLKLPPEYIQEIDEYFVILMHPGVPVPSIPNNQPRDVSSLAIRIPEIMKRPHFNVGITSQGRVFVYIYDTTESSVDPPFLGGAMLDTNGDLSFMREIGLSTARALKGRYRREHTMQLASRNWTFTVTSGEGAFVADVTFVILLATVIFMAALTLALWIHTNARRIAKMNEMKAAAEAEKAAMMVKSAKEVARRERELNDFIAHEVRNPLSAALSACSFVKTSVCETPPLATKESREAVQEDVGIIDNSLHFINDLLRNMLDEHRASSNQLTLEVVPTDLLRDILVPSAAMLYRRAESYEVILECPENLVASTDRLRLQQIILNLGRNAAKFVMNGFVRFRAEIVDGKIFLYVEDSGPGIPYEKRDKLFSKFQESLDSLNQGTGIGLSLCKRLAEIMGFSIWLDETYDSGVVGCPGTRFVISLNSAPISVDTVIGTAENESSPPFPRDDGNDKDKLDETTPELPKHMSVLFVDDDLILRKLFSRSIRNLLPDWQVEEAANGETALQLTDSQTYDIIFLDQYMASTEKQLLGTETARALRAKGVNNSTIICGLSANDIEQPFLAAGADCFSMKPFPCEKDALKQELLRIVRSRDSTKNAS